MVLVAVTTAVALGIAIFTSKQRSVGSLPAGFITGDAIANLADRMLGGSVTDFLDLGWWPAFNLADVFIVVGVGLLLLSSAKLAPSRDDAGALPA